MTPKEKATQLTIKYYDGISPLTRRYSIQCAIIAVREILTTIIPDDYESIRYWEEVKEELNNMI
jgi:hypothetical protein